MFLPIHLLKALCITKLNMHPPPHGPNYKMVGLCYAHEPQTPVGSVKTASLPSLALRFHPRSSTPFVWSHRAFLNFVLFFSPETPSPLIPHPHGKCKQPGGF